MGGLCQEVMYLPKKGTQEALEHPLLASQPPQQSCLALGCADSMLVAKFKALCLSRTQIVLGCAVRLDTSSSERLELGSPSYINNTGWEYTTVLVRPRPPPMSAMPRLLPDAHPRSTR